MYTNPMKYIIWCKPPPRNKPLHHLHVHQPHVVHDVQHPCVVHYVHQPHIVHYVPMYYTMYILGAVHVEHDPHALHVDLAGVVEGGKQGPPAGDGYLIYWLEADHFAYHSTHHSINTDQKSSGKKSIPCP